VLPFFTIPETKKISASGDDACYVRQVVVANEPIDVYIKRSRRKSMAIHVSKDKPVELRVPLKCPWIEIDRFLESRLVWIQKAIDEMAAIPHVEPPRFKPGSRHDYLGQPHSLVLVHGKPNLVEQIQGSIVVRCSKPGNETLVAGHLDQWYRSEAMRLFPERIDACKERFPVDKPYEKLIVRKMKARWGSCSRQGDICLNSLLVKMPSEAIDFVITHELCHLRYFSHGKSFYRLLSSVMPDWREREDLLIAAR
jgi:predicted metal-dependent hydrolase